jgi:hypothetical protein
MICPFDDPTTTFRLRLLDHPCDCVNATAIMIPVLGSTLRNEAAR